MTVSDLQTLFYPPTYPKNILWDAEVACHPVFDLLEKTAQGYGMNPAIDFLGFKMTWGQVYEASLSLARSLQNHGVGRGTQVGLFLPNTPYYLIAYYAIARTGATIVNFNPLYAEQELVHQINDSQTTWMITSDLNLLWDKMVKMPSQTCLKNMVLCPFTEILPFPKNILFSWLKRKDLAEIDMDTLPCVVHFYNDFIDHDLSPRDVSIDSRNDIALLQYTGGTTGVPKGAMLTHANVVANVDQCSKWLYDVKRGQEKMLGVLPFFHVFAMTTVMNFSVQNALEIIALPKFDLDATMSLIHRKKPHYLPAVPAIYNAINNHKKRSKYNLKSLKACISGGAPLPIELKKGFEANTGCVMIEGYGLTEASPVVAANPIVGVNKVGSIGLPFPQTIVELIDPDDKTTPVKTGERGELCVRGPQVMKGYWNKPEDTAQVLRDGRLYTGDIAVMDEDGYIFIVDRLKDMIITNGYNVYPRNVEEAIYAHPAVEECIVAGLPDAARGEIIKAWVKVKLDHLLTADELRAHLSVRLSPMEMPRLIEFRDKPLPKTMIGKLSRKDIVKEELDKNKL